MNTTTYLQEQFENIHVIFQSIVNDITDEEWLMRPAPGWNLIGYTIWHIPRTQDILVQTWIRNVTEVAHTSWQAMGQLGSGLGITLDKADEIARRVSRANTLAYADAVHHAIHTWLGQCSEHDLDHIPDARKHLAPFPEYQTPGFVQETAHLDGQPVWSLLMRPCIGHIHRHLGELEVVKEIIRSRK